MDGGGRDGEESCLAPLPCLDQSSIQSEAGTMDPVASVELHPAGITAKRRSIRASDESSDPGRLLNTCDLQVGGGDLVEAPVLHENFGHSGFATPRGKIGGKKRGGKSFFFSLFLGVQKFTLPSNFVPSFSSVVRPLESVPVDPRGVCDRPHQQQSPLIRTF